MTRIAFCVDASPSLTSTFGVIGNSNGPCCALDRLPDMARTFFNSLIEPVSASSLGDPGLWCPVIAVTVIAVIVSDGKMALQASFVSGFFSVPIGSGDVHHFMGWAFPHCTAVPFVTIENRVYTMNDDEDLRGIVAAWGSGGGKAHAKLKNLRRSVRIAALKAKK